MRAGLLAALRREARSPRAALLCAALGLTLGCVGPKARLTHSTPLHSVLGPIELKSSGQDPSETARVAQALVAAAPGVRVWGAFKVPVEVSLLPSHEALENAVRRRGYAWLRAWGRYGEILLQSPRTWPGPPVSDNDLKELLVHELTHCLMFQRSAAPYDWPKRRIPLWFREGMASWTAGQAYRRPSLDDLAALLEQHEPLAAFTDAESLSQTHERFVYGVAHHAFTFLVKRYGEAAVHRTLDAMEGGRGFKEAFRSAVGVSEGAFTAEFERFVRWGGHRRAPASAAPPRRHR